MTWRHRALRLAAYTELVTLAALLLNRLTVHHPAVSAVAGPVHGIAYLTVLATALLTPAVARSVRWRAALPGIGGLLTVPHLIPSNPGSDRAHLGS
ncbi:DUF3817 domain-containing protein [Streptomyces celluloflavus]|uniref:DUF3817 domain-containing protein n=1 Tax=Streptomyces celluloflavus TaxID=58344 RepID=A0ABW7RI28_9ACTN|nr:hypothetical protein OG717_09690 [Streptomyces celluloflavus]